MRHPDIDDRVILLVDIPETPVCRGSVGVVCSRWSAPYEVLEVEFITPEHDVIRLMIESQNVTLRPDIHQTEKSVTSADHLPA